MFEEVDQRHSTPIGKAFLLRRRRWRAGFAQLVMMLAGLAAGLAIPLVQRGPVVPARQVSDMLVAIGLGLLGTIAVIFSLLFLVVQWASTTFTPRLTLFRDDPIVWRTFAFAIGQSVFDLTTALAISGDNEVSVIIPTVAVLLLLAMLSFLRVLQLRAFASIQLAPALASIADRGRLVLNSVYPPTDENRSAPTLSGSTMHSTINWPHPPAVLQQILVDQLRGAAREADALVVLLQVPGTTLQYGTPIAEVHNGYLPDATVVGCLVGGRERTFTQDPLLALRLLADIGLRALSPAVNDPATAVQALDEIEDLLVRASSVNTVPLSITDDAGTLRVVIPLPGLEDFVRAGLDDLIAAAVKSPLALNRIRTVLVCTRSRSQPRHHRMLTARLDWIDGLIERFHFLYLPSDRDEHPA